MINQLVLFLFPPYGDKAGDEFKVESSRMYSDQLTIC
jgi:hypothetical protein